MPQTTIDKCIGRMTCWVRLLADVIKTEFPMHSLFSAFYLFRLPDNRADIPRQLKSSIDDRVRRLATFFKLEFGELQQEFADMFQLAASIKDGLADQCNFEAWRMAVENMEKRKQPVAALRRPLEAWIGWSISTSGVEQDFSKLRNVLENLSHNGPEAIVNDLMIVISGSTTAAEDTADIAEARALWAKHFGAARAQHNRISNFTKKCVTPGTEAAWLASRRADVDNATSTWIANGCEAGAEERTLQATEGVWTAKMQKEVDFQHVKGFKHLARAQRQGHMIRSDVADLAEHNQKLRDLESKESERER